MVLVITLHSTKLDLEFLRIYSIFPRRPRGSTAGYLRLQIIQANKQPFTNTHRCSKSSRIIDREEKLGFYSCDFN